MQYKTFKEFRLSKKLSQKALAEKLYVTEKMIQKWEKGDAIPDFTMMNAIAEAFFVSTKEIVSLFKPEEDTIDLREAENARMYQILVELFNETDTFSHFSSMADLFCLVEGVTGFIRNDYALFPFTKCVSSKDEYVLFSDEDNNVIPLTERNVLSVMPWNCDYDVYTFRLELTCPVLKYPDDAKLDEYPVYISFIVNR